MSTERKFYELTLSARLAEVAERAGLTPAEAASLSGKTGLTPAQADHMVENAIGTFALPLGVAQKFCHQWARGAHPHGGRGAFGDRRGILHGQAGASWGWIPGGSRCPPDDRADADPGVPGPRESARSSSSTPRGDPGGSSAVDPILVLKLGGGPTRPGSARDRGIPNRSLPGPSSNSTMCAMRWAPTRSTPPWKG